MYECTTVYMVVIIIWQFVKFLVFLHISYFICGDMAWQYSMGYYIVEQSGNSCCEAGTQHPCKCIIAHMLTLTFIAEYCVLLLMHNTSHYTLYAHIHTLYTHVNLHSELMSFLLTLHVQLCVYSQLDTKLCNVHHLHQCRVP